ncbi:MAG: CNNM domain-containing protein [Phycisphaerae bacterium]
MITLLLILGAAAAVAGSAFFSATETGAYTINRVRLRLFSEQNRPSARTLAELMARPQDLVITTLIGATLADYVSSICVAALLATTVGPARAEIYTTAIMTPIILILGGMIPKDWFRREADRLMYFCALPLYVCMRAAQLSGLIRLLRSITRAAIRRLDPARLSDEDAVLARAKGVKLLLEGVERGDLSPFQRDLFERVMKLSQVRVASVMIPRARAAMAPFNMPREDFLRAARMAHISRFPVYRDDPRYVVGVVQVFDVLSDPAARPLIDYIQQPCILRPSDAVPNALLRMQRTRQSMAIVQDTAGHCLGILTIKDLVEEIVGELEVW